MINCIIVDDEPLSRRVIQKYLEDLPHLNLIASCSHAFEAMEVIQKEPVDLIFLDINMPRLSGINFAKTLSNPPLIIFTTAYPEFAVEGFELEAVDYLLKPFSQERFLKAVNKASKLLETNQLPKASNEPNFLIIKADKKLYKLNFEDILYLQAYGDYVKIFTNKKTLLTKERLSNIEANLPANLFQKIHRSYIISLEAISFLEGNQVKIEEIFLPISNTYRTELLDKLHN
jgi:two-component system, LytTR family, response regulator